MSELSKILDTVLGSMQESLDFLDQYASESGDEGLAPRIVAEDAAIGFIKKLADLASTVTADEDEEGWYVASGYANTLVTVGYHPTEYMGLIYNCEGLEPEEMLVQAVVNLEAALLAMKLKKERPYV